MKKRAGRILVVEDEESIGQGLCDVLSFRGHEVTWSKDGNEALGLGTSQPFDLLLLDVMLPGVDGFTLCARFRESGVKAGVIMLTAKGSEDDILRGFDAGADDYVTKPFSLKLLLARIEAVLGRSLPDVSEPFACGTVHVDPDKACARRGEDLVELSARELAILRLFAGEPGRIISRRVLLRDVWEMQKPDGVETRTVDVTIGKLRKKLNDISLDTIESVRGQGYRYVAKGRP